MPVVALVRRVHAAVRAIPRGRVSTYADVALAAGSPGAARTVGGIMAGTTDRTVPCHRVVRSDGTVATAGLARRLRAEGVAVQGGRVVGFERLRWPS